MKIKTKVRAGGLSANHNVTVKLAKNGASTSRGSRHKSGENRRAPA
jgi:hypothetical protein